MNKKQKIKDLGPYQTLYRCPKTGIAWVEDGNTGLQHSAHPNIDASGSVAGMRKNYGWGDDKIARTQGTIYNIDRCIITDDLDAIANQYCHCGGKHNL